MNYYINSFIYNQCNAIWLLLILLLALSNGQLWNRNFEYAQLLERRHNYEEALKIYQKIYQEEQTNTTVIDAVIRCQFALNHYEEVISFLKELIIQNISELKVNWSIQLAEAYCLNNQKEEALSTWWTLIDENKNQIDIYKTVAVSMINQRLFNEAIEVYLTILKNTKDNYRLHLEIGNLYKLLFDLGKATEHYLKYFQYFPGSKSMLQHQILSLTTREEDIAPVILALNNFIKENPEDNIVKEILAGLYIKYKYFDKAYEIYQSLEKKDMKGKYLFDYARDTFNNGAFIYSMKAYQDLINNFPDSRFTEAAKFGLGNCHSELAYRYKRESQNRNAFIEMNKAISIFDTLIINYKDVNIGHESYFIMGNIFFHFFYDFDKAIHYYKQLLKRFPNSRLKEKVTIFLGDIYLIKGNMVNAQDIYRSCLNTKFNVLPLLKLAELDFFRGNFQSALMGYTEVISKGGMMDSLTNNALSRRLLLYTFIDDTISLKKYAHAELLIFQKKLSEAIEQLLELVKMKIKISIVAGRRASEILITMGKYLQAIQLLNDMILQYKGSEYFDMMIFLLAYSEEKSGNLNKALVFYKLLLDDYPNSLYLQEARNNARLISEKLREKDL
jgi:tetratricopeptide (TPR) repeat protein